MHAKDADDCIGVLIVDDDPLVVKSQITYFVTTRDIGVTAEAFNGIEALSDFDKVDVDVILADIHKPEMDGVTLLGEVQKRPNPLDFGAITALDTDHTILEVLTGGVRDVWSKIVGHILLLPLCSMRFRVERAPPNCSGTSG